MRVKFAIANDFIIVILPMRVKFASANDFIIVILPMIVNFLFDHCLQTPSTFLIVSL